MPLAVLRTYPTKWPSPDVGCGYCRMSLGLTRDSLVGSGFWGGFFVDVAWWLWVCWHT